MPEFTRSQVAITALVVFVVVFVGARAMGRKPVATGAVPTVAQTTPAPPVAVTTTPAATELVVHVAGEVRKPGIYRLPAGARVADAITRAGGPARRADLDLVNLAAKVSDGQQILVPRRGAAGAAVAAAPAGGAGGAVAAPSGPINLNTATADQLDTLDGVGPATAEKILAYRTEHGSFTSVEELAEVPGIGPKKLAALREQVTV